MPVIPPAALLLVLAVALPTASAPLPKELRAKAGSPFPTALGTRWEYVVEGTDKLDHTRDVVEEAVEKDGTRTAAVKWTSHGGGYGERTEYRVTTAGDVERVGLGKGHRFAVPYLMISGAAKPGDTWNAGIDAGGRFTCTRGGVERVTTPAGKFAAFSVRFGSNDTNTYWYAPGVGLVKWANGGKVIVLSKYAVGRTAK